MPPERSPERDAAIVAMLPHVPELGWTKAALRRGLADPGDAELLFPGGVTDMVATFADLADRDMERVAAERDIVSLRLSQRVRAVVALRLEQNRPHREAVRRALAAVMLPGRARVAVAITARTVDAIWHAAGDRSADTSWYTKRLILAGVYSSTLLVWLRDVSGDDSDTLAFLDRRLADVARLGRMRRKQAAV